MKRNGFQNIDEYIVTFPKEVQRILIHMRRVIKKAAPEAIETISYQMPTFKLNRKNLVHFAAWKTHIGFYPTPSGTKKFKKEIVKYKASKGAIQFPIEKPLPYNLIKKIVAFRVKEIND